MEIACLDLEGVLVPEIWIDFAERTGIEALKATTRDIPDYDVLMSQRLQILKDNGLKLQDIQAVIADIAPLDGAAEFIDWLRERFQVVILSDTFYELAWPLVEKLGYPSIICHNMTVENDKITGYKLRQPNNKQKVIEALQSLKFKVFASGDSYNDINMLNTADLGIFFQAPKHIKEEYPHLLTASSHNELKKILEEHI